MKSETKNNFRIRMLYKNQNNVTPHSKQITSKTILLSGLYRARGMTPSACTENKERTKGRQFPRVTDINFTASRTAKSSGRDEKRIVVGGGDCNHFYKKRRR
jgi:hypothetical protein